MWRAVACAGSLIPALALAQEPVPVPVAPEAPVAMPLAPALPASFRSGYSWVAAGPAQQITGLAVLGLAPDTWAAADRDGAVWVSRDAGTSWTSVLEPPFDADRYHDADAAQDRIDENLSSGPQSVDVNPFDPNAVQDAIDQAAAAAEQARADAAAAEAEAEAVRGEFEAKRAEGKVAPGRVWFDAQGTLYAGRQDGLFRSTNLGRTWTQVLDVATFALAVLPGSGLKVAGTADGVRFSVDGIAWIDADDGTEGLTVFDVSASASGVFAATQSGVWFAPDGQTWRAPVSDAPALSVLADPDWDGGAWVGTPSAVLRTDDAAKTLVEPYSAPLANAASLVRLGPGRLAAATGDGPWESLDGGVTWSPIQRGLTDPTTYVVAVAGATLVLGGDEGLYVLRPAPPEPPPKAPAPFVTARAVVHAATTRVGLNERAGSRMAASFVPQLTLQGDYGAGLGRSYYTSIGTSDATNEDYDVSLTLKWVPSTKAQVDDTIEAFPLGDELILSGLEPGISDALVSVVSRSATQYRRDVAKKVDALWFARAQLAADVPAVASTGSLTDQVMLQLDIAEVEARLDAYTDGAVSRWRAGVGGPPQEE